MQKPLAVAIFVLICALGAAAQFNGTAVNCSSIPSPCGWNATCNDTDDGPECLCEAGYLLNSTQDCEMCPWGTWGWYCANECNCTGLDNTTTCDHVNGSCPDDGIINCDDNPCGDNALCWNVNDTSYECYCTSGYQLVNETSCEVCGWNAWGLNCSGSCNCTDNTTTCNPVTGLCPEDEINCGSSPCGANALCQDIGLGEYQCYCPSGYLLVNDYWCMECPGGTWGPNCTENCMCGEGGNGCHHISGSCECNDCYTGAVCEISLGADCVQYFLEIKDKCEEDLKDTFGGDVFPRPPRDTLTNLAVELMDLDNAAVIQAEPEFYGVSREDVNQGPLVKLTWMVDKDADRPSAEAGLDELAEQVKLGNIRSTLIINSREDSAKVTLNSGVRKCDDV